MPTGIHDLLKEAELELCAEISPQDVDTFLYCEQKPLTYARFLKLLSPFSKDFRDILITKEVGYYEDVSMTSPQAEGEEDFQLSIAEYKRAQERDVIAKFMRQSIVFALENIELRRSYLR